MSITPKTRIRSIHHLTAFEELMGWVDIDADDIDPSQSLRDFCEEHDLDIEEVINTLGSADEEDEVWGTSTGSNAYLNDDDDDDDDDDDEDDEDDDDVIDEADEDYDDDDDDEIFDEDEEDDAGY